MYNHITEACDKWKYTLSWYGNSGGKCNSGGNESSRGDNAGGSDKTVCYHWGIPGHIRPNCAHNNQVKKTQSRFGKGTASIGTPGDQDLLCLYCHACTPSFSSAHTTCIIDCSASHHLCYSHTLFKSFKKLYRLIFLELGHGNMVWLDHHWLDDATQGYKIDALYTPTFYLWSFSIIQLDSAESTAMFGCGKYSISSPQSLIAIPGHHVNDLNLISPNVPCVHTASTLDALLSTP